MQNDSKNKWFLRLGAESAAVVISILLAFAIDAWWADRQDEIEEMRILAALRSDFDSTLDSVREMRKFREAKSRSIRQLFEASAGKLELSPTQIDRLLNALLNSGTVDFSVGALDSLFEGGGLSKIQNMTLRQRLTSFTYLIEWTKVLQEPEWFRQNSQWRPFFWTNTYFPQIENAQAVEDPSPQIPVREIRDHSFLLSNDEFLGMLASELNGQSAQLRWYAKLEREIEQTTELIDSELSRR